MKTIDSCALVLLCRSSLLPNIHKPVCGGYVKVLPTEDFLTLRVLVRFSPHMLRMKNVSLGCPIVERFADWNE
jgi:hypothetical protein